MVTILEADEFEVESNVTVNIRPFLKSKVPDDYAAFFMAAMEKPDCVVPQC